MWVSGSGFLFSSLVDSDGELGHKQKKRDAVSCKRELCAKKNLRRRVTQHTLSAGLFATSHFRSKPSFLVITFLLFITQSGGQCEVIGPDRSLNAGLYTMDEKLQPWRNTYSTPSYSHLPFKLATFLSLECRHEKFRQPTRRPIF